jgi:uncharacterized protein
VEEFLPDIICKHIIEQKIKPAFKAGNYYEGLNAATDEMMGRLSGNFVNDDAGPVEEKRGIPFGSIIIILIIIIIIVASMFGGGGGTLGSGGWIAGSILSGMGGGGDSGGGGFGGFGGGDFGGGGAGGSW